MCYINIQLNQLLIHPGRIAVASKKVLVTPADKGNEGTPMWFSQ